jgi:glycosyltransferase involved in cell wall biosynthesis
VHNICKGLVENDIDVTVLIANATEQFNNIKNKNAVGVFDKVQYRHVGKTNIRSTNWLKRRIDDFWRHLLTIILVLFNRTGSDITVVIGPSFDFRLLLPMVAGFTKTKMVLEINEYPFVSQNNALLTGIKRSVLFKLIFPLYDGFIVISEELSKVVNHYKAKRATVIKVPVLASQNQIVEMENSPIKEPYIIHAGSLNEDKDGVLGMLEAFAIAIRNLEFPIKYVLTGKIENSPYHKAIRDFILRCKLDEYVVFTGHLRDEELWRYLRNSSLAIINKYDTKQNRYCFATKLAVYLSFAIPVITTTIGESRYYLRDGLNAYLVEPRNPQLIADKIVSAFTNIQERENIARAGKNLSDTEFSHKYQGKRIADYFTALRQHKG